MSSFSNAGLVQRLQILEDALAEALTRVGDITHNDDHERCVEVIEIEPWGNKIRLVSLYSIARMLEVRLA